MKNRKAGATVPQASAVVPKGPKEKESEVSAANVLAPRRQYSAPQRERDLQQLQLSYSIAIEGLFKEGSKKAIKREKKSIRDTFLSINSYY